MTFLQHPLSKIRPLNPITLPFDLSYLPAFSVFSRFQLFQNILFTTHSTRSNPSTFNLNTFLQPCHHPISELLLHFLSKRKKIKIAMACGKKSFSGYFLTVLSHASLISPSYLRCNVLSLTFSTSLLFSPFTLRIIPPQTP